MYVPAGWWHAVLNLDATVAVTHNYASSANFADVWRHTKKGRPKMSAKWLAALRQAFDETMKDPAFLDEARRAGLDIDPVSGQELEKITRDILASPPDVTKRLAAIIAEPTAGGANPSRRRAILVFVIPGP